MAEKLFINYTGQALKVQLIVRQGDNPRLNADPVNFELGSGAENEKLVTYGTDTNLYLNGIAVGFEDQGSEEGMQLFQVIQTGTQLDKKLNTNNTITFFYAGSIRMDASNRMPPR